jgi:hypothetical protein
MGVTKWARPSARGSPLSQSIHINPKAGGFTPHPPYVPVRPFPSIQLNPKAGGLTPHPPYAPVLPFPNRSTSTLRRAGLRHTHPTFPFAPSPNDLPQLQGGRAYATPTLRSRSRLSQTIYLSSKAGGLTPHPPYVPVRPFPKRSTSAPRWAGLCCSCWGKVRRRCRVVGRRLEIAFPWGDTLSGEPGGLTNS